MSKWQLQLPCLTFRTFVFQIVQVVINKLPWGAKVGWVGWSWTLLRIAIKINEKLQTCCVFSKDRGDPAREGVSNNLFVLVRTKEFMSKQQLFNICNGLQVP